MAVVEGCRKECREVTDFVLRILSGQSKDDGCNGISEAFHMSLSLCTKISGLVESQGLVPLILMSGTTFTQLSLLVTVECGPSQTHLLKSKDMIVKLWQCLKMQVGPDCNSPVQSVMEKLNEIFEILQEGSSITLPTWMLQAVSQWFLLFSLLCAVNGEVSLAEELVTSLSLRGNDSMLRTSLARDLVHVLTGSSDGSAQARGNSVISTKSMDCAMDTSEYTKPNACSEINSPLLKIWTCIEHGAHGSALAVIYKEMQHKTVLPEFYHLMAGWCHFAMSRYNLALIHFSFCLSCEQVSLCAMDCMSVCYRRLGQFDLEVKMLHHLCEATTHPIKQISVNQDCILFCGDIGKWFLSLGITISSALSNMEALYTLAKRNLQLNRVAESTIQLRSLVQSIPQSSVMPESKGLVPAVYLTAIKAYIHEGAYKEAMDLCEKMSATFCCKDLPSDIPYDLDSVELHSVIATVSYLRGRALMGSVECRTAEALDYFERVQTMTSSARRESLHTEKVLIYIDQVEMMTANSLAICLVKMGKTEAALSFLTSYLANHPVVQQEMMYNYCQLLSAKGLLLEAATNWLKFRQIWPSSEKECEELLQLPRLQDCSLPCGISEDAAVICSKYDVSWLKHCAVHQLWRTPSC